MIIDQHLQSNYEKAHYIIGRLGICLKANESNADLDILLLDNNAENWAIITAFNPKSEVVNNEENRVNQLRLKNKVDQTGHVYFPAINKDPDGLWPDEESLLILDISPDEARRLASAFGQNALLFGEMGQVARLIWTQE